MTRADGRWTTLDGQALYAHLKTASALYHAELRAELTRRLGVEWEPVAPGKLAAEIRGVPRAVLRDQSRRRQEIVRRMEDRGESSPRGGPGRRAGYAQGQGLRRRSARRRARAAHADRREGIGPGRARRHRRPSAAGATRQGRAGAHFARAARPARHDRASVHVLAPRRHPAVGHAPPPGRIGRPNRAAHRPLAGPAGDRRPRTRLRRPPAASATSCRWRCPTAATSCGTRPGRCWPPSRPCSRTVATRRMRAWPSSRSADRQPGARRAPDA